MMNILQQLHSYPSLTSAVLWACGFLGYILYKRGSRRDGKMIVPMATFNVMSVIKGMTSSEPHIYLLKLAEECEGMVFRLPLPIFQLFPLPKLRRVFVVGDVKLARRILQDPASDKPPEIYSSFEGITNRPVMFTSRNSAYTKSIRKMAHTAFSQKDQMHLVIKKHVDRWLDGHMRELSINNKSFDPVDEALAITFYIMCDAAFGYEASYDEFRLFTDNLDKALTEFAYRQSTNPLRKMFWFLLPGVWQAKTAAKVVMEFAERMRKSYNTSGNNVFMDSLRYSQDNLDAKQQASEILMFMAAGHETSGSMISNVMIQLSQHQNVQAKLRQSLLLGKKNGEKPEDNAYFKSILLEANRIFPVAPMGSTRETRRDFDLNDGTYIPAHSICFLPQYLSYRDTTIFDNEDEFNPDRWDKTKSTKDMIDTASLAFSLGPRNCPGKPLAVQEMNYLLPRLLLRYSLHQQREGHADYRVIMKHSNSLLKIKKVRFMDSTNQKEDISEDISSLYLQPSNRSFVRRIIHLLALTLAVGLGLLIVRQGNANTETCATADQCDFKIAVLTEPSPVGSYICGQSKRIEYLMNYLVTAGNDTVELITAEVDSSSKPSSWLGIPIHYTFGFGLPSYNQISISFDITGKAVRELYRFSPDLIHATTPGPLLFPSIIASRLFNVPIVMSCHTHLTAYAASYLPPVVNKVAEWLLWRFTEVVHSFADLTLVTSPQIQEEFMSNRIATSLWTKGVNSTQFHPHHKSDEMRLRMTGGHPEDFLIVYIGRLAEEKRLTILRDVIQGLPGATLCLVGTGPHEQKLKRHFEGSNTIFLGQMEGDELSQAFASADIFVMPSKSETLGFVVLESMASRVPVVAANAGGLKHLIQNATTGYLVSPDSTDEFIHRIQELKSNPTLRDLMADAARRDSELWSWERSMKALRFDLYPQAIQNCEERPEKKALRLLKRLISRQ